MTPPPAAASARGRLTAEDVVDAAVGILQDFGMGDLSMRRVAAVLGVQASALYWHVPDKQTLLARVADRIVAEIGDTVRARRIGDVAGRAAVAEQVLLRHRDGTDVVLSALALGLGGGALHTLLTEAADSPEEGERALALLLGTVSLRQQRSQAQALGVVTGPDFQGHRRNVL
ncbi:TetR family transcriptional regulator [Micrococcus antarcticus]|uniref:TetR family transcriptional regulator n=1 Tax=Micrococcus antarcticus TaxID=86171 RepID=UPI002608FD44|nr:TetR family transcriptional regulator [uncultured Micrococcus sp.]